MTKNRPLAYHITFGTYGTRLHGDERGTVDRSMNQPGDPIIGRDDDWNRIERERLNFPPREFTPVQRLLIEELIPLVCNRGKWTLHTCAAAQITFISCSPETLMETPFENGSSAGLD